MKAKRNLSKKNKFLREIKTGRTSNDNRINIEDNVIFKGGLCNILITTYLLSMFIL